MEEDSSSFETILLLVVETSTLVSLPIVVVVVMRENEVMREQVVLTFSLYWNNNCSLMYLNYREPFFFSWWRLKKVRGFVCPRPGSSFFHSEVARTLVPCVRECRVKYPTVSLEDETCKSRQSCRSPIFERGVCV